MAHGPWDPVGPFWPKSIETKRGQGGSPLAQKDPKLETINHGPHFQPTTSGNHQGPPAPVQQVFPWIQGKIILSFMDPIPKDPGMVHILYNIPLCTIFPNKSNGDVFRNQLHHFNSIPQIHHPF
ncbi:hypothetical protein O181_007084 [Austropuccinia psidii MF-1]|uniref:Uncharacterized protein n=1 Tax=Austropuccinia psidii MF-1 TaxID=1389203 RepID=A0A9Q3BKA6_9BASI|nr:hypothetical protein [Austropuccinia psidii MF-1]